MKINLTKQEYRALVVLLELGDWVMHAHEARPEARTNAYQQLKKRLLSYYRDMGMQDAIEYARDLDDYFAKQDFEQWLHEQWIGPYEEISFWEQLTDRLSVRDLIREVGQKRYQTMDGQQRLQYLDRIGQQYAEEFDRYGLERLYIDASDTPQSSE